MYEPFQFDTGDFGNPKTDFQWWFPVCMDPAGEGTAFYMEHPCKLYYRRRAEKIHYSFPKLIHIMNITWVKSLNATNALLLEKCFVIYRQSFDM